MYMVKYKFEIISSKFTLGAYTICIAQQPLFILPNMIVFSEI